MAPRRSSRHRSLRVAQERRRLRAHAYRRAPVAAAAYMQGVNRASMSDDEVAASMQRESSAWTAIAEAFGDALQWVYQPTYDPANIATPRDCDAILRRYQSV